MLCNEVVLLETLCFDLTVEHPHTPLLEMEHQLNSKYRLQRGQPLTALPSPGVNA